MEVKPDASRAECRLSRGQFQNELMDHRLYPSRPLRPVIGLLHQQGLGELSPAKATKMMPSELLTNLDGRAPPMIFQSAP
jgi:hypothetical protein